MSILNIALVEANGNFFVSSKEVALRFDKEHKDVLRAYRNLIKDIQDVDFIKRNFAPLNNTRENAIGLKVDEPEVLMTKDGFMLLAMGFTGKQALNWKTTFIKAFDQMGTKIPVLLNEISELQAKLIASEKLQIKSTPQLAQASKKGMILAPVYTENLWGELELTWKMREKTALEECEFWDAKINHITSVKIGLDKQLREAQENFRSAQLKKTNTIYTAIKPRTY